MGNILSKEELDYILDVLQDKTPLSVIELDAEIVNEQARQIRCLQRDLRDARTLHHNYKQGVRTLLAEQHPRIQYVNDLQALIYAFEDEHPGYPRCDWKLEVANNDTVLGYWEWVMSCLGIEAS
ncbi:MAG: hypothetical protein ACRBB6_04420 [Neptuniibacter sp.]